MSLFSKSIFYNLLYKMRQQNFRLWWLKVSLWSSTDFSKFEANSVSTYNDGICKQQQWNSFQGGEILIFEIFQNLKNGIRYCWNTTKELFKLKYSFSAYERISWFKCLNMLELKNFRSPWTKQIKSRISH